jgi:hypothetical protein
LHFTELSDICRDWRSMAFLAGSIEQYDRRFDEAVLSRCAGRWRAPRRLVLSPALLDDLVGLRK